MACEEAAFSMKHSAVSENQNQHQRPFTAEDAEESKNFTTEPRQAGTGERR